MKDKEIILPNGGFVEYLNSAWYEIYKIIIDEFSGEITLLDEHHHPRGNIGYLDASKIVFHNYFGETEIPYDKLVQILVINGKVVI